MKLCCLFYRRPSVDILQAEAEDVGLEVGVEEACSLRLG